MLIADSARFAVYALVANRMRSFLTLLGIAVGVAAIILLTSIGEGVHRYVVQEFSQFGTNIINISPGKVKTGGQPTSGIPSTARLLTLEDAKALEALPHVKDVSPMVWGNSEVEGNGRLRRSTIFGAAANFVDIFSTSVQIGTSLPHEDTANPRALVVLGSKIRNELFGSINPLGSRIRIGGLHFRVVGVLAPKGQILGFDLDDTAFIPAQLAMELYNRDGLTEIHVIYDEDTSATTVSNAVKATLTLRHGKEDFTLVTQEDMLKTLSNILNILTIAVGALGAISLLVGAVGIATMMTISVTERTNEIGLLIALGARQRHVLILFLWESILLAMFGGVAGLLMAAGIAKLLHITLPSLPIQTPWHFIIAAFIMSAIVGLLAGALPAIKASRLNPIDALRAE